MPGFTLEFTTKNDGLVVINGDDVKYWKGTGIPTYEGSSEGFHEMYPEVVAELMERNLITFVKD